MGYSLVAGSAFTQNTSSASKPLPVACPCSAVLDEAIDKVSRMYAGFDDKVTAQTRSQYSQLLQRVRSDAGQARTMDDCGKVLTAYTSFFRDSHVFAIWNRSGDKLQTAKEAYKNATNLVEFNQLNPDFVYVKLAHFNERDVNELDSLLRANAALIARTPNLILDLRGNGGGNTSTSEEMIKLIYTNPIIYPAQDERSSKERIEDAEKEVRSYRKDTVSNAFFYQRAKKLVQDLKANPGGMVRYGDDLTRTADVSPTANPQRVALLIDKDCGSSTEYFVYEGKQSRKVTTFGTNTHGVMDYGGDQNKALCDGTFNLAVPWSRTGWTRQFRIDNVGFAPDVRIPTTERD
ncbi:S41 family peptidase [Spirosoma rhododendri]|nr:S41 family peptidase [Spirosoma rhododendri]